MFRISFLIITFIFCGDISTKADACGPLLDHNSHFQDVNKLISCLNDRIVQLEDALEKKTLYNNSSVQTVQIKKDKQTGALILRGCVKSSELPTNFSAIMNKGLKLCRDDGSIWLRITDIHWQRVSFVMDSTKNFKNCGYAEVCEFEDRELNHKFRVQFEYSKRNKYAVGYFRKINKE